MKNIEKAGAAVIGYEYKDVIAAESHLSMYVDCYHNFGWEPDETIPCIRRGTQAKIKLKRDRKIMNKAELTRLQQHFEACGREITVLERSKTFGATIWAIGIGMLGTVFMTSSTFAVIQEPPLIWLCVALAVPGFIGWILPYFLYKIICKCKTAKIDPLMEEKYDEIYAICEKGRKLI